MFNLRSLFIHISTAVMMLGVACRGPNPGPDKVNLPHEAPFGLQWDATDHYAVDDSGCRDLIASIAPLVSGGNSGKTMAACLADQTSKVFLSRSENPEWFQEGDISVTLLGGTLPARYSYSYLEPRNSNSE